MLFYLTNSLIVSETDADYNSVIRSAKYLAMAFMEKSHLLRGDYQVLSWLAVQFEKVDRETCRVYRMLVNKYSTFTIPNFIHSYISVIKGIPETSSISENGCTIRPICHKYFLDSSKIQKMVIVGEALYDVDFYTFITEQYVSKHKINVLLSRESENGGGTGVAQTTTKYINKHCMVASIIDSDSKYKGHKSGAGTTRYICEKEWTSYHVVNEIFFYKILEVQEIENLIPPNFIDAMNLWTGQNAKNKNVYDKLAGSDNADEILPYYDLKVGLIKDKIMNSNDSYLDYVMNCCKCLGLEYTKEELKGLPNGTVICNGLLKGLMKATIDYINKNKKDSIPLEPVLLTYQAQGWEDIASFMLDMCCAENIELVI